MPSLYLFERSRATLCGSKGKAFCESNDFRNSYFRIILQAAQHQGETFVVSQRLFERMVIRSYDFLSNWRRRRTYFLTC